jgi:hypothetical protein
VGLGLASARLAIQCLAAGRPQAYEAAWWRLVRPYWMLTSMLLRLASWPPSRRAIVPVLARAPGLLRWGIAGLQRSRGQDAKVAV